MPELGTGEIPTFFGDKRLMDFDDNLNSWKSQRLRVQAMRIRQQCDHWKKEAPGMLLSLNPDFVWEDDRATL